MPYFDLRLMKNFVTERFPADHPLWVILSENDTITDQKELLAKVDIWLRLARRLRKGNGDEYHMIQILILTLIVLFFMMVIILIALVMMSTLNVVA